MRKGIIFLAFLVLVIAEFSVFSKTEKEEPIHRYAMIIGANFGGPGRDMLHYAVTDAQMFMHVMEQMGGIKRKNSILLVEPTIESFNSGMQKLRDDLNKTKKGQDRTEMIFYYSGHSDEDGLLFGKDKLGYVELRKQINTMPADVKIAILDSCSSGAFTRFKGGKMLTPFMSDPSFNMKGYAYMTSSSSDEMSQESERIKGSFFTHYLLTGLRGAADMTQDGRITLNEAYQYAYRETLLRTEQTAGGAQHPNYNIQMSGTGDVILTDIRTNTSMLTFSESVSGRLYINRENTIVAEFSKEHGETLSIALDEGKYIVLKESPDGLLHEAKVTLKKDGKASLISASFNPAKREITQNRGGSPTGGTRPKADQKFGLYLFPVRLTDPEKVQSHNFVLHLFGCNCDSVRGFMFGTGVAIVRNDAEYFSVSLIGNVIGGNSSNFELGGLFNITGKDASGVQIAGLSNVTMHDTKGAQVSIIANITGHDFYGIQTSGIINICSNDFYGIQDAGLINVNRNNFHGVQLTSLLNYNGQDSTGAQISALCNITKGKMNGLQLGIINIANEQQRVQLGLVNVSDVSHGVQFGVINYSDQSDGYPIGLISIIRNGTTQAAAWTDETNGAYVGIRHGNNRIYNLYAGGYDPTSNTWGGGIGIGVQAKSADLTISTDLMTFMYARSQFMNKNSLRLTVSYAIIGRASLFAGASINHMYVRSTNRKSPEPMANIYLFDSKGKNNRYWPGVFAGVQY